MENIENKQNEESQQIQEEINEILNSEFIDATTSINIIVSAVHTAFNETFFNDLDRQLIAKALLSLKKLAEGNEDIILKVSQ